MCRRAVRWKCWSRRSTKRPSSISTWATPRRSRWCFSRSRCCLSLFSSVCSTRRRDRMAATTMARPRRRLRVRPGRLLLNLFLLAAGIIFIFPLIWVFFTSFKTDAEIVRATPTLLPKTWTLDNYLGLPSRAPFLRFFVNSLLVSGVSTVFIVFTCTVAGYVFAKYRFPGRNLLFFLVICTILIPIQTYIVPLYVFVRQLQWLNTYQGMTFPTIIMSSGIFFLRQSIRDIPDDLIEA